MEIRIPTNLSKFELYKLAEDVVNRYELNSTNVYKFPINIFNLLASSMNIEIDNTYLMKLADVFQYKGTLYSVEKLLKLLGIECDSSDIVYNNLDITLNLRIPEVSDLNFVNYISDALNYLILYSSLHIVIENYVKTLEFITQGKYKSSTRPTIFNLETLVTDINVFDYLMNLNLFEVPTIRSVNSIFNIVYGEVNFDVILPSYSIQYSNSIKSRNIIFSHHDNKS